MRRHGLKLTAIALATSVIGIGGATAASAVTCPSGYTCMYGDRYYLTNGIANRYVKFASSRPNLSGITYEGSNRQSDDDVTSVYNNGNSQNSAVYVSARCTGTALVVYRGGGYDQLNTQAPSLNDRISSAKFIAGTSTGGGC